MTARTRTRLAWSLFGLEVVLLLGLVTMQILNLPTYRYGGAVDPTDAYINLLTCVAGLAYVGLGALILIRAGNVLGWLLCAIGLGFTIAGYGDTFPLYVLVTSPGSLPGARYVSMTQHAYGLAATGLALLFLLFPNGHVPSRRWRPLVWILPAAGITAAVAFALREGPLNGVFNDFGVILVNPIGILDAGLAGNLSGIFGAAALVCGIACVVSLVIRYRRSTGDERQQIRWLAYVGAATLVLFVLTFASGVAFGDSAINNVMWLSFFLTLVLGIPVACAVAVLRYRLYDLDLVIKKTVIFASVVAALTVCYLVVVVALPAAVVGIGPHVQTGAVLMGAAIGLSIIPIRNRARRFADRVVYGHRATPFEVMSDFSERVGETYSVDDVLPRMTELLAGSTGAAEARVWLRSERRLLPVAVSPPGAPDVPAATMSGGELPSFGEDLSAFPVTHQGELLGAITLRMPPNDPMDPTKERLVHGLASQAGLALSNVGLVQDLRESRRRIVAAQDERAKTLERNIHDGAQQQLVALAVKLRLTEQLVERDPVKARSILAELQADATDALENLRDLARGIYPPLLADKGLAAALQAQGRKSPVPVEVVPDGVSRYSPEVEATVYFCCLEALGNVAKYAHASHVQVRLHAAGSDLRFAVQDDGVGFDPSAHRDGTGLQGMRDRVSALGGTLTIEAARGTGVTVSGSVPAAPMMSDG